MKKRKNYTNRRRNNDYQKKEPIEKPIDFNYHSGITVNELSQKLRVSVSDIIKKLFMLGTMVTINSTLDDDIVELIALEYNVVATKVSFEDLDSLTDNEEDNPEDLKERAPIITIMGHVDHGKTTLLDTIRNTDVATGEYGGITQHIGAYQVTINNKKLTFLDTPGHEAFTEMRARGSKVTDIVIIVVAADDGVMPQTKEAVDHAKAAGVPILVAVNKIDKTGANFERIYSEMSEIGVTPEEWGGDTIFTKISARNNEGIKELLESLLVIAEVLDLKANPNRLAYGTIIEAKLDKGRGPVATLLVENGTLRSSDSLVIGSTFGRVRRMSDDKGREITEALPATPVEIIGLNDVPSAGDNFKVYESEKEVRAIAARRLQVKQNTDRKTTSALSLDDLSKQIEVGELQEVQIILKTDVQGTAEAIKNSLEKIEVGNVRVNVIRASVGGISESDISLATASNALVYGFNVRPTAQVRKKAEEEGVEIRLHTIIYKLIEEVEDAMKGLLEPEYEEVVYGQAEVRQTFKASKIGTIAGSFVTDGKIVSDSKIRLIRDGIVIFDGILDSLKRFQNDTKEVAQGYECGIVIKNFNDIKTGDIIESYGDEVIQN